MTETKNQSNSMGDVKDKNVNIDKTNTKDVGNISEKLIERINGNKKETTATTIAVTKVTVIMKKLNNSNYVN